MAARPGTTFFAPAVRIRKLGKDLVSGPEAGEDMPLVAPDVLRVEVTRANTGPSKYAITLNNWYDSLPRDRRDSPRQAEVLDDGQPLWPRYKYNDFQHLEFGDRLRIDMRYWPDPPPDADEATRQAQAWVPMVAGPITDMSFRFDAGEGAQVTVSGEDDLSPLQDKNKGRKQFSRLCERSIVARVLDHASYGLRQIAPTTIDWPPFAEDDAQGIDESLADGQAYLAFLEKLAERLDFEIFLEFADLADPNSGLEFHFEPARSRGRPEPKTTFVLRRETNLLAFAPTIKVVDQYSEVEVMGRHRDRNRPEPVTQPADPQVVDEELYRDEQRDPPDPPLVSGPNVRERYFANRPNPAQAPNQSNLDPDRAAVMAVALLRKKSREFLVVQGATVGLPRLRPGRHVEIRGYRPPFDGFYYVTGTVHTFGPDGLQTRFTARRPGMPLPPYNEV